jgi:hypothetical protein
MGIVSLAYIPGKRYRCRRNMANEKIVELKGGGPNLTLEQLRNRITTYESEMREYLRGHDANIETYKFAVEKEGDGYSIEVGIKASIHPKNRAGITK